MYLLLTSFFLSLLSILFMIGKKVAWVRDRHIVVKENQTNPLAPDLQKIQNTALDGLKNLGKLVIFTILKIYVKLGNFLKNKYSELKTKIKNLKNQNQTNSGLLGIETNKFLKVVSEYKNKLSKMKNNIDEEEEKKM